jgi:hypothetical protein
MKGDPEEKLEGFALQTPTSRPPNRNSAQLWNFQMKSSTIN